MPTITGPGTVCINSIGNQYYTEGEMTGYEWSVIGGNITAGLGTDNITVTWTTLGTQSVSVTYTNAFGCPSASMTVYDVLVNPIANVDPVPDQVLCNGSMTAPVDFTGSIPGTVFNWTNTAPSIGLASSGSGDIASFMATNVTNAPVVATVTVTPSLTVYPAGAIANPGFETGDFTSWTIQGTIPMPVVNNLSPHTGTYAAFLGSPPGYEPYGDASFYQQVTVPAGGATLSYWYFPYSEDYIYFDWQDVYITDLSGNILVTVMHVCSDAQVWTNVTYDMSAFAGQTVRVMFLVHQDGAGDVTNMYVDDVSLSTGVPSCSGTPTSFTITVNPLPTVTNSPLSQTICSGAGTTLVTLTSNVSGTTFAWTATATAGVSGFTGSGTNTIPVQTIATSGSTQGTVTYAITPTANGCVGTVTDYYVYVNPLPSVTNSPLSQTICSGGSTTAVTLTSNVSGTTFAWTATATAGVSGFTASGTSTIPVQTITTSGTTQGTVTYTITPTAAGCAGPITNYTIMVNPVPTVIATPLIQTVCSGSPITPIVLTSNVPGTTFSWTRNNFSTLVGMPISGTGDTISGTLTNTIFVPVPETFFITPSYTYGGVTCTGTILEATVWVNPTPTVTNSPLSQTICSGASTTLVTLTSNVSGTTFAWTATATAGVSGFTASGTSTIPVQTITTSGTTQGTVTYAITPTAAGCVGPVTDYYVYVNPLPSVTNSPLSQTICSGASTTLVTLTSNVAGTTFAWTATATAGVSGFTASGTSTIPVQTITTSGTTQGTVTYVITPTSPAGCVGAVTDYYVYVNPLPSVTNSPLSQTICSGASTTLVTLTSNVPGTTFTWTATATAGVAGFTASGTSTIPVQTITTSGTTQGTVTYAITPTSPAGCVGAVTNYYVYVNPLPSVTNSPLSQTICSGVSTTLVTLTSNVPGTTFSWTATATAGVSGFTASGTSTIPVQTISTSGSTQGTVTYVITPTSPAGCVGPVTNYYVYVNPLPSVTNSPLSQTICSGSSTTLVTLTSNVSGTTFAWTATATAGVSGFTASGTNTIPVQTITTSGITQGTVTYVITPTSPAGCVGPVTNYYVYVNPLPSVTNSPLSQTICSGASTTLVTLTSNVGGTTFAWTATATAGVSGFTASGTSTIPVQTISTSGSTQGTVTYAITPTSPAGCVGPVTNYYVYVNPLPLITNSPMSQSICSGFSTTLVTLTSNVAGSTFAWTATATAGVSGFTASGTSTIPVQTISTTGATQGTVTYAITATSPVGCVGPVTNYYVYVNPLPVPTVTGPSVVCVNTSGNVYTTQAGMSNYIWSVSPGGTVTSGGSSTSNTVTVTWNSVGVQFVGINYTNSFGCTALTATTYNVTVNPRPLPTISGPDPACIGSSNVYTTQAGMSNYTWAVSAGGTITAGGGTANNTVTVTWNVAGAQSVSVNYFNSSNCSALVSTIYNVTVNPAPVPTISGPTPVCIATTGNVYSTQSGMTNYIWSVSAGGSITAGGGTANNTVTVTWNVAGPQTVSVNYTNSSGCTASSAAVFNVTVNPLPVPTITGQTNMCVNSGYYTYTTETGMQNYTWAVSSGGLINYGSGTYQITVSWIGAGAQTVSVNYSNGTNCYALQPTVLNVTVNPVPDQAGTISGSSVVCAGQDGVGYSVAPIANATTYVWALPPNASIASGAGTNSITVNFAGNATSGDIFVYGNNLCGNGGVSPAFPVTVNPLPDSAGTISGQSDVCIGASGVIYSVAPIANATGYLWTVPTGVLITAGNNTSSITVTFTSSAVSGDITVQGTNSCGNGTVSPNFAVTVNPIPPRPVVTNTGDTLRSNVPTGNQWYFEGTLITGATSQTYVATQSGYYWDVVTLNGCSSDSSNHKLILITGIAPHPASVIKLYPVPNDGRFNVSITTASEESFSFRVYNNLGVMIYEETKIEVNGSLVRVVDISTAPNGMYTVVITSDQETVVKRIIVNY
jgi:hypothetical protein